MSWKKVKLGEILNRRKEIVKVFPDSEYKLVTIKLYHKGVVLRNVAQGAEIKSPMSAIKAGDFILSGIDARNGAFGIVPDELEGAIITNDFWCLDPDESRIDKEFLLFLTSTEFFDHICKQSSDGTTQRIRLQKDRFFNYEISLPAIEEQKVILKKLKELKNGSESITTELTHQLTLVQNLRRQLLQEAVQGKLAAQDPSDEPATALLQKIKAEKERLVKSGKLKKDKELPAITAGETPFELPDGWVWCRLGEVVNQIFDGPFGSHLKTADYTKFGVQVIRLENLGEMKFKKEKQTFISDSKYQTIKQHTVYEGDILVGSFLADGVKCVVLPKLEGISIAKADCFCIRIGSSLVSKRFIMFLLSSNLMFIELSKLLRGMTRLRINTTQLKNLPIPLPPLPEQRRIVQKLEQLLHRCDTLEASIQQGRAYNGQLLQQVLREALQG